MRKRIRRKIDEFKIIVEASRKPSWKLNVGDVLMSENEKVN